MTLDMQWINQTVHEMAAIEDIHTFDVESFLIEEVWLAFNGSGFYAVIEELHLLYPERRFVYVGTTKNLKRRLREHRQWIYDMRLSIKRKPLNKRGRLWVSVYPCDIAMARSIERRFWRAKQEMGLTFLSDITAEAT